eukprot:gnl/TRDRNA2_/TRDRNA2_164940_c2_seq1.p1 gnl/TRDRNA2_/TRDRNA2_164940_c2~~gnl/TRDRNA2_/TRDRNA2_164940_c2_seq1.p1  ORF type:complete len:112 (+),score=21.31 gnl/TRDRNA2_/TRDRNA2_164940_c2_seq1:3-338(+)
MLCQITHLDDLQTIFKELNPKQLETMDIDEFCQGIMNIALSTSPAELRRIERNVQELQDKVEAVIPKVHAIYDLLLANSHLQGGEMSALFLKCREAVVATIHAGQTSDHHA